MTKYSGMVGFVTQKETVPGVWTSDTVEKPMRGDVLRASSSNQDNSKVNSDVSLMHRISLVGSARQPMEYYNIKYVVLHGIKWEVTGIEIQHPRIILSLGGMWNG